MAQSLGAILRSASLGSPASSALAMAGKGAGSGYARSSWPGAVKVFIATAPAGTRTLGSQDVAAYLRALAMPPALADTLTGHDWVHEMLEYITSILRASGIKFLDLTILASENLTYKHHKYIIRGIERILSWPFLLSIGGSFLMALHRHLIRFVRQSDAFDEDPENNPPPDPIPWLGVFQQTGLSVGYTVARVVASTGLYKWVDRVEGRRWSWKLCKELGESLQRKVGRALEVATGRARYVDCTAKAARTVWRQAGGYAVVDAGLMLGVDVVRHVRALAGWQGVRELEVDEDGVPVLPPKSKVPGNWQFLANSFVQAGMRVAVAPCVSAAILTAALPLIPYSWVPRTIFVLGIASDVGGAIVCAIVGDEVSALLGLDVWQSQKAEDEGQ